MTDSGRSPPRRRLARQPHPALFSSVPSIVVPDQNPDVAEFFGSMIALDDPRHFRLWSIVQKAFTPRWWPRWRRPSPSVPAGWSPA